MKLLRKKVGVSFAVIGLASALQASTHELVRKNARNDLVTTQTNLLRELSPQSLLQALAFRAEQLLSRKESPATTQSEWVTSHSELLEAESLLARMSQKLTKIAAQLTKLATVERQLEDPVVSTRQGELVDIFELWQDSAKFFGQKAKKRRNADEQSAFYRADDLPVLARLRATVGQREKAAKLGLAGTVERLTVEIKGLCRQLDTWLPSCGEAPGKLNSLIPALKAIREHLATVCQEQRRQPDCQRLDQILALDPSAITKLSSAEKLELESWVIDQTTVMEGGL